MTPTFMLAIPPLPQVADGIAHKDLCESKGDPVADCENQCPSGYLDEFRAGKYPEIKEKDRYLD